jgi:hypothetical protein
VRLPFLAHAQSGIPITLATTAIAGSLLWLSSVMPP